jgi:hypothetical protein
MQIQIAPPGPAALFDLSVFGRPTAESQQFVHQMNQGFLQRAQNYGAPAQEYFQRSQQFFTQYYETSGYARAETMLSLGIVAGAENSDYLRPLMHLDDLRAASVRYQDYLMANPLIQQAFLDGRIDGYTDTYTHTQGNNLGMQNDRYREVISGQSLHNYGELPEDVDEEYVITAQDGMVDAPELTFIERLNIVDAWTRQNIHHDAGDDSTSIDGFKVRKK